MSTTLSAHGGGAQPARIDSSGKVTGGAAMRVYGFASEAEAQAAGYVCEGGPAMSVALITDAQLASGEWKLDGDPFAVVIYTAPDNIPSEGGFAMPVYAVNGWGSAPAPGGLTLPDVASATLLLDLQADMLALNDGDPVSTWSDQSGNNHNFTQTGSARPVKQTLDGQPVVVADGVDDWMLGDQADDINNLTAWAYFMLFNRGALESVPYMTKCNNDGCEDPGANGWTIEGSFFGVHPDTSNGMVIGVGGGGFAPDTWHVVCGEMLSRSSMHFYVDGAISENPSWAGGSVFGDGPTDYSTTEPLRLFTDGLGAAGSDACDGWNSTHVCSYMIYRITDLINWPTDRAAITAWLAARYGITL